jgi:ubiquinone/menaquinone biosynthesis C-methylase UbiE
MKNNLPLIINNNPKEIDSHYFKNYGGGNYSETYLNYTYNPVRVTEDLVNHGVHFKTLLDLGCASGELVVQFRKLGIKAYGIDNDPEILRKSVCPEYCKLLDMRDISSIPDKTFDVIYANSLMYVFPQELIGPQGILLQLKRICKKAVYLCNPFKGDHVFQDPYRKFLATPSWWEAQFKECGFIKKTSRIYLKNK